MLIFLNLVLVPIGGCMSVCVYVGGGEGGKLIKLCCTLVDGQVEMSSG